MILKASQRSGASALADHLMNDRDNDHVTVAEVRGFMADDLHGALKEAHAISKATQCKQYLFSVSLNPPQDQMVGEDVFLDAAQRIENKLGLDGQPRAIVFHEKEGRRHAHVVWSRIDGDEMKAIPMPHFKTKLRDVARDLFLDHGWVLPDGLATYGNKNPLNFDLQEWQIAKRQKIDPREIKQAFQDAWARSDNVNGFENALEDKGYYLARGDRRGFVAVDLDGNVYAVAKWAGLKSKDVQAKLGTPEDLPSVDTIKTDLRAKVSTQMKGFIAETEERHQNDQRPLREEQAQLTDAHKKERNQLIEGQENRWKQETQLRSSRINSGVRGLFDRLSGKTKETQKQNETAAFAALKRDQKQRQAMIEGQLRDRQRLQRKFDILRENQRQERTILARDIASTLRMKRLQDTKNHGSQSSQQRRSRQIGFDIS